jgi:hypothetical protein
MIDGKRNDSADNDASQGAGQNGKEDVPSSKRDDLIDAAEIVGGIIFTGIAIAFSDAGFHI